MLPPTADVMDVHSEDFDSCELQFRQYGGRRAFSGRLRTVRSEDDNVLLRDLLATPGDGQVLVVDGAGSFRTALVGDMIARAAMEQGWAGVIINGCVRDTDELSGLDIGIKALGSNPRKSGKTGAGEVDVPVSFGGATFTPGAEVISDADGVIVAKVR